MVARRVQLPNSAADSPIDVAATAHKRATSPGPQPPTFEKRAKYTTQKTKNTTSLSIMPSAWSRNAARYSSAADRFNARYARTNRRVFFIIQPPCATRRRDARPNTSTTASQHTPSQVNWLTNKGPNTSHEKPTNTRAGAYAMAENGSPRAMVPNQSGNISSGRNRPPSVMTNLLY